MLKTLSALPRSQKILILLIVVSVVLKIFVLGKGYLAMPDEYRHIPAQDVADLLMHGKFKEATAMMFTIQGRPGAALYSLIPAAFQVILANKLLIPYNSVPTEWILYIFNYLVFIALLITIFKVCKAFGLSTDISLLSVFIYSITLNSYIYLRHTFPYDGAMLCLLLGLFKALMALRYQSLWKLFSAGAFLSFGLTVYPGYFPLAFATIGFVGFSIIRNNNISAILKFGLTGAAGFFSIPLIFELTSRALGMSYFNEMKTLSGTIVQGSFGETHTFLFSYLYRAEQILGVILMLFIPVGLFGTYNRLRDQSKSEFSDIQLFLAMLIAMFLIYVSLGVLFHKMVFYGRLLHQYYPFLAIITAIGVVNVFYKSIKVRTFDLWVPFGLFAASIPAYLQFGNTNYPRFSYRELQGKQDTKVSYSEFCAFPLAQTFIQTGVVQNDYAAVNSITLVNFCFPYDGQTGVFNDKLVFERAEFKPKSGSGKIFSARHFLSTEPYLFEGAPPKLRNQYRQNPLIMEAYLKNINNQ